jgi:chromosome segregation ATPase
VSDFADLQRYKLKVLDRDKRIAELEADLAACEFQRDALLEELDDIKDEILTAKRLNAKWMDERTEAIIRAERAEKDAGSLRTRLDACLRGRYGMNPERDVE